MDMDVNDSSEAREGASEGKQLVVILVGAPGSGKSTFCENVMHAPLRPWVRICQDTIGNGKAGTKAQCIKSASSALSDGKNVFIDRCNLDREQRADFVNLRNSQVDVHAVVLDLPAQLCISRSVKRTGHEGNLQGGKAAAVVNRMLQKKELPKLSEGFSRITFCHNDADVKAAVGTYIALRPSDDLPHGCFGQRNQDAKVQVGIMKFLKKVNVPSLEKFNDRTASSQDSGKKDLSPGKKENEPSSSSLKQEKGGKEPSVGISVTDVPTLAFPSISTADFQFDLDKASDIIVEKVEEFLSKIGNARLVLVDLTHGSRILSLVKTKAAKKNIDPSRFFTFVGDIVHLFSKGGLRCNVIANAANWRLKPGGGGVNAAIFNAAGPDLEDATKARAKSLFPGNTVVVPLPSTSPLYVKEGVTHVIHVLGPNMNPQRPNCLDGNYAEGCRILQKAYTSLFEGFISTLTAEEKASAESNKSLKLTSHSLHHNAHDPDHGQPNSDQKNKREDVCESGNIKKSRGSPDDVKLDIITHPQVREVKQASSERASKSMTKGWGSWAQALYQTAMHPEQHKDETLEVTEDVVVIKDVYPKAQRHLLVLARAENLDRLADVREEHLGLLRIIQEMGLKWAKKFLQEDSSLVFRLGYHSVPSMRQLHLHVISQDFNSGHLKHKKHWNSFNTVFFRDSVDVIEEVSVNGKATVKDDENVLSMELRCHRCRSAHPNIPRLKTHISNCRAPFPAALLQNGRLVAGLLLEH